MHTVTKHKKDDIIEHTIYTEAEAKAVGRSYVPWSSAQRGDWGLTDDGYIAECIDRKTYKGRDFIRFSFAGVWLNQKARFGFLPFFNSGNFGGTSPRGWLELEMGRTRFKLTVRAMAKMILGGNVDYEKLALLYRTDQKEPVLSLRRLLRRKEVKAKVAQQVDLLMDEAGLTDEYALKKLKAAIEMAEIGFPNRNGDIVPDLSNMLRGLENLIELRNMRPKSTKFIETAEFDVSRSIQGTIESESKTLTMSRQSELPPSTGLEVEE